MDSNAKKRAQAKGGAAQLGLQPRSPGYKGDKVRRRKGSCSACCCLGSITLLVLCVAGLEGGFYTLKPQESIQMHKHLHKKALDAYKSGREQAIKASARLRGGNRDGPNGDVELAAAHAAAKSMAEASVKKVMAGNVDDAKGGNYTHVFMSKPLGISLSQSHGSNPASVAVSLVKNHDLPVEAGDLLVSLNSKGVAHLSLAALSQQLKKLKPPITLGFQRASDNTMRAAALVREAEKAAAVEAAALSTVAPTAAPSAAPTNSEAPSKAPTNASTTTTTTTTTTATTKAPEVPVVPATASPTVAFRHKRLLVTPHTLPRSFLFTHTFAARPLGFSLHAASVDDMEQQQLKIYGKRGSPAVVKAGKVTNASLPVMFGDYVIALNDVPVSALHMKGLAKRLKAEEGAVKITFRRDLVYEHQFKHKPLGIRLAKTEAGAQSKVRLEAVTEKKLRGTELGHGDLLLAIGEDDATEMPLEDVYKKLKTIHASADSPLRMVFLSVHAAYIHKVFESKPIGLSLRPSHSPQAGIEVSKVKVRTKAAKKSAFVAKALGKEVSKGKGDEGGDGNEVVEGDLLAAVDGQDVTKIKDVHALTSKTGVLGGWDGSTPLQMTFLRSETAAALDELTVTGAT